MIAAVLEAPVIEKILPRRGFARAGAGSVASPWPGAESGLRLTDSDGSGDRASRGLWGRLRQLCDGAVKRALLALNTAHLPVRPDLGVPGPSCTKVNHLRALLVA
jgi:hypothetical protein